MIWKSAARLSLRQGKGSLVVLWLASALLSSLSYRCAGASTAVQTGDSPQISTNAPSATNAIPKPEPGDVQRYPAAFRKSAPTSINDLRAIQTHVESLVARVSGAVVSVRVGMAEGSAVVVSKDGLVLSAAHVCRGPGQDVDFTFPDGKTAKGRTLGTNLEGDAGLMQITDKGPWPYVPIGSSNGLRVGDWVLAFGHPGGFDPQRAVVARLGRVVAMSKGLLQTDCTLLSGDSGGPLFDMSGRVVGIHSRISESADENYHVPIGVYLDSWERLARGESWGQGFGRQRAYVRAVGASGVDDPQGCRLNSIDENGPAFLAGLKVGDIVTRVNDRTIKGYDEFRQNMREISPGQTATLGIKRAGADLSVQVTIQGRGGRRGRGQYAP